MHTGHFGMSAARTVKITPPAAHPRRSLARWQQPVSCRGREVAGVMRVVYLFAMSPRSNMRDAIGSPGHAQRTFLPSVTRT
jgi:hypothetical protein